ncbi:MAG: protein kinase [Planctomycetota bacterium]
MFASGDKLDHYVMERQLGTGTFGQVWLARESITDRLITVYFTEEQDETKVQRFERAISLLARLVHPAIVTYVGHGIHRRLPYFATEHINGPSLGSLAASGGRMDELRVLHLASQVADGLEYAWRTAEVIHRDLKPDSILIDLASMNQDQSGIRIKIRDFGYAMGRRLIDQFEGELEKEETQIYLAARREVVGTPMVMSPEQVRGGKLSVCSDMYALGVTMYLLLTGHPPFSGSREAVMQAHLKAVPPDLTKVVPGLRPQTAAIVRRLLAKAPEGRFPDWTMCQTQIRAAIERLEPRRPAPPATTAASSSTASFARKVTRPESSPKGVGISLHESPASSSPADGWKQFLATAERFVAAAPVLPHPGSTAPPATGLTTTSANPSTGTGSYVQAPPMPIPSASSVATTPQYGNPVIGQTAVGRPTDVQPGVMQPTLVAGAQSIQLQTPMIDDGLTGQQRAAVWAFLFRNPAVLASTLTAAQTVEVADTSSAEALTPRRTVALPRDADDGYQATVQPATARAPGPPAAVPPERATRTLTASSTHVPTKGANPSKPSRVEEVEQIISEPEPEPVSYTVTADHRRAALDILDQAVLGRSRNDAPHNESVTKRITARLHRLIAGRDSVLAAVDVALNEGRFATAQKMLDHLAETASSHAAGNDANMCLLRARLVCMQDDFSAALRWAQSAVNQELKEPTALAILALCRLHLRQDQTARAIFKRLRLENHESPLGPIGQGVVAILSGHDAEAIEALANAAKRQAQHPALLRLSALRLRCIGDLPGESSVLRRALQLDPQASDIRRRLEENARERSV